MWGSVGLSFGAVLPLYSLFLFVLCFLRVFPLYTGCVRCSASLGLVLKCFTVSQEVFPLLHIHHALYACNVKGIGVVLKCFIVSLEALGLVNQPT
jgi:hypothetical protein